MCLSEYLCKEEMQTCTHTQTHTHLTDLAIDKDKGHALIGRRGLLPLR